MTFCFQTAGQITFGPGTLSQIGEKAVRLGHHAALVRGASRKRGGHVADLLRAEGISVTELPVTGEPTVDAVMAATSFLRSEAVDFVVAAGGGSVLDMGKAVAGLIPNPEDPICYLEVVGEGRPLVNPPLPVVAIPTTAGTGAEVTANAVIGVPEHRVKVSLRHPGLLPEVVIVDPELMQSMPKDVTLSTGMDAFTQLLESFVSRGANPITDGFCREGILRVARSLGRAVRNGNDMAARSDMALASLLSGMALANAKLGAVHGIAGPMGGMFPVAHGRLCAALLVPVLEGNLAALYKRQSDIRTVKRFQEIAVWLTGNDKATAEDGIAWIRALCRDLGVKPLGAFGIGEKDIPDIVEKAMAASSMKGNPVVLTAQEVAEILKASLPVL